MILAISRMELFVRSYNFIAPRLSSVVKSKDCGASLSVLKPQLYYLVTVHITYEMES